MLLFAVASTLFAAPPPGPIVNFVGVQTVPLKATQEGGFGLDAPGWSSYSYGSSVSGPSGTPSWTFPGNGTGWHDLAGLTAFASSSNEWTDQMYDPGYHNYGNSYISAQYGVDYGVHVEFPSSDIPHGASSVVIRIKARLKADYDVKSSLLGFPLDSVSAATVQIGPLVTKTSKRTVAGTHRDNNTEYGNPYDEDMNAPRIADGLFWTNSFGTNVIRYVLGPIKAFTRGKITSDGGMLLGDQSASGGIGVQVGEVTFKWNAKRVTTTVVFQGLSGSSDGRPIQIDILDPTTQQVLQTRKGSLFSATHFMSPDVADGSYTVRISSKNCLPKVRTNVTFTDGQATNLSATLKLGDVNSDGVINAADATLVSSFIGMAVSDPEWPEAVVSGVTADTCDLDGDGDVDNVDLAIVQAND